MKNNIKILPLELHSILIGIMLSDGGLYKSSPTANVRFEMSLGEKKISKWMDKLDSIQSVTHHDSDFSLTTRSDITDNTLQQLVAPDDSASQISEVISESDLQNVVATRVYDMNNINDVLDLMNDPCVVYSNIPLENGDDLITFYTADSANEILRSTLEALLSSVN